MNVSFHWAHTALGFAAAQRGSEEHPCNSARPACHTAPCGACLEGKGNLGHPERTEGPGGQAPWRRPHLQPGRARGQEGWRAAAGQLWARELLGDDSLGGTVKEPWLGSGWVREVASFHLP